MKTTNRNSQNIISQLPQQHAGSWHSDACLRRILRSWLDNDGAAYNNHHPSQAKSVKY